MNALDRQHPSSECEWQAYFKQRADVQAMWRRLNRMKIDDNKTLVDPALAKQ